MDDRDRPMVTVWSLNALWVTKTWLKISYGKATLAIGKDFQVATIHAKGSVASVRLDKGQALTSRTSPATPPRPLASTNRLPSKQKDISRVLHTRKFGGWRGRYDYSLIAGRNICTLWSLASGLAPSRSSK